MATYRDTKGYTIETVTADPVPGVAAWSSGGVLNTARDAFDVYNVGTQTASMATGGYTGSTPTGINETYNGSAWTEVADVPTAVANGMGAGTTAAAYFGFGATTVNVTTTYTWNGTAWTSANAGNTARRHGGAFGGATQGIAASGFIAPGPTRGSPAVESWDGTNWTEVSEMNTPRDTSAGLGTSNSLGIIAGGNTPPFTAYVEAWNGSSWTEVADLNTPTAGCTGLGSTTAGLVVGGGPPFLAQTQYYDGSTWTELADMATARGRMSGGGTTAAGVMFGGGNPTGSTATEEWNASPTFSPFNQGQTYYNSTANAYKITMAAVPGGAWASGTSLSNARGSNMGSGISNSSALCFGGITTPGARINLCESYDGTTWTEVADTSTATTTSSSAGTQTAALKAGGYIVGGAQTADTEIWNGSAWTEVANLITAKSQARGAGTSTASLSVGGYTTTDVAEVESWNGSAWSEIADLNTIRLNAGSAMSGTQTSTMVFGGNAPGIVATNEEWNGSAWTEVGDLNTARRALMGSGTVTDALAYGGNTAPTPPGITAITEHYNGSAWTEVADLATADLWAGCNGSGTSALIAGGEGSGYYSKVEAWTANITNKTITVT